MSLPARILAPTELSSLYKERGRRDPDTRFPASPNAGLLWQRYMVDHSTQKGSSAIDWYIQTVAATKVSTKDFKKLASRRKITIDGLGPTYWIPAVARRPCVIGAGTTATYENAGFSFHHTYGFPVIPGSSIKGLLRHFLEEDWDGKLFEDDDPRVAQRPDHGLTAAILFGEADDDNHECQGSICFHDAWPDMSDIPGNNWLERDILAIHSPKYYRGPNTRRPDDTENPDLVPFLRVKQGVQFEFPIAFTRMGAAWPEAQRELAWLGVLDLLESALHYWGIGAKTGAGYGRFELRGEKP